MLTLIGKYKRDPSDCDLFLIKLSDLNQTYTKLMNKLN